MIVSEPTTRGPAFRPPLPSKDASDTEATRAWLNRLRDLADQIEAAVENGVSRQQAACLRSVTFESWKRLAEAARHANVQLD